MPKKPKKTQVQDTGTSDLRDRCETPGYALDPILPFLPDGVRLWEPACGSGRIVRRLRHLGYRVIGSDLMQENPGKNFFTWEPPGGFDCIITNPPYSIKPQWIRRCYQLGRPFALLVPVETIGSGEVQKMMEERGGEILLLDKRVNFYMPLKGDGGSAQFPTLWLCWNMLPEPIMYGKISRWNDNQMSLFEPKIEVTYGEPIEAAGGT